MKTRPSRTLALLLGACLVLGSGRAEAAEKQKLPPSKITALDLTNMVIAVDWNGTNVTVFITPETRFFKDAKYAVSKDLKEGDTVRGTLKQAADDRREAVRIFWGKPSPREK